MLPHFNQIKFSACYSSLPPLFFLAFYRMHLKFNNGPDYPAFELVGFGQKPAFLGDSFCKLCTTPRPLGAVESYGRRDFFTHKVTPAPNTLSTMWSSLY